MAMSNRLLYSFILMAIVPLLIFAAITYMVSNRAMETKISDYSIQTQKAVKQMIGYECKKYEHVSDLVMINGEVQDGLRNFTDMNPFEKNAWISSLNRVMSDYMSNQPDIMQIYLINNELTPIYSQGWFYFSPEKLGELVEKSNQGINWISVTEANKNYVIYTRPVIDRNGNRVLGYVSMHINPVTFMGCFSDMKIGTDASYTIVDELGNVIVSQNSYVARGEPLDQELFEKCKESTGPIIRNYDIFDRRNTIVYTPVERQNWTTILILPNDYLYSESETISLTTLICVLACICCAVIVYRNMKDCIIKTLGELMEKNEEEQREKRESELKMLQAQINPHFLFNTLNSLRWTAMMSGADNVSNGLAALSNLLSNTIIDTNQFVTVEDELKNIESYIAIQRIRYGDIFSVNYQATPEVRESYIIKFLLQPIVENAIIHGINEEVTTNVIDIKLCQKGENLLVEIIDNGKGFDKDKAFAEGRKKQLCGFTLKNVKERIALCFGREYYFDINSVPGEGTRVCFEMPFQRGR
ncbi:MAG: sensor histidine kinase [Pseudobutyrivibrio sp.]|nr:sensor histidine kinase [Pseudobutyrivibrio sp.]